MKSLNIFIPTLNESACISQTILNIEQYCTDSLKDLDVKIFIVDGKSVDGTQDIVRHACQNYKNLNLLEVGQRGRGHQLSFAMKEFPADAVIYMDCDLATPLLYIKPFVNDVLAGKCDLSIASRYISGEGVERSTMRKFFGKNYSRLVRFLFKTPYFDYQCGFKCFSREALKQLLPFVRDERWVWDTEIVVRAHLNGLRIDEKPVSWEENRSSKVHIVRDSIRMGSSVIALALLLRKR